MERVFVDLHDALAGFAERSGVMTTVLRWTNIVDVDAAYQPGSAVVSPANSLGFMDGGVDYPLSRVMFPGVESALKAEIARRGELDLLGRPHLPIGEALAVPTGTPGVVLVSAPTMWLPQDVRGTHNAYHATYAALRAASAAGCERVIFPGMCTGCGRMAPEESMGQVAQACRDVDAGRPPRWSREEIVAEQPRNYMNTEFRPPGDAEEIGSLRHV